MPILTHPLGDLEYLRYSGSRDLPVAVFLHEGLGSAGQWGRLPSMFHERTGASTLVYSRHGYGGSAGHGPSGPDYLRHEATRVLVDVLAAFDIRRPLLVGHSDGATIAALYAAHHPVAGAALIAPHIFVEPATLAGIRATENSFADKVRGSLALFHDDPDEVFRRWSRVWLSPQFADFDITVDIGRISAPLLVLQGEHDQYATTAQLDRIERVAAVAADIRLLPDRGHHPHLEQPDEICEALVGFARSHGLAEPAPAPVEHPAGNAETA
ncbi:MAG: alpha/beta hydrolase [Gordonia sp. (in: high G+C Gram-positive bacteria)]